MKQPRFKIGEKVFIYDNGKLTEKVITNIQILMNASDTKVGYKLSSDKNKHITDGLFFYDRYLNENEVFATKEEILEK